MYEVLKPFTDKYTGVKYEIGDKLEITKERATEILSVDKLIKKLKNKKK